MVSYPWLPGNKYGDKTEPRYNAITYTWGRYAFNRGDPAYANGQSIAVDGIGWKEHMPRMKPRSLDKDSFHPDELSHIVRTAASPYEEYPAVEFIWLDIACIDQTTPRVPEYFSEIGRQAKIFRGASDVFVWLRNYSAREFQRQRSALDGILAQMWDAQFKFGRDASMIDPEKWMSAVEELLKALRSDVWFSSLWTLQEAFLSPNAAILFRSGLSEYGANFQPEIKGMENIWRLKDISYQWNQVRSGVRILHLSKGFENYKHRLECLETDISKIGILDSIKANDTFFGSSKNYHEVAWSMGNPLSLLAASYERRPSNADDEIYGIMQVFEFQLGRSSPEHRPGQTYTLEDLRDQLGAELMKIYPIASQLIVQGPCCATGKAWRVNNNISLPETAYWFWRCIIQYSPDKTEFGLNIDQRASIRVTRHNGDTTAKFTGLTTPLKTCMDAVGDQLLAFGICDMWLDSSWTSKLFQRETDSKNLLLEYLELMEEIFPGEIFLLFLGRLRPPASCEILSDEAGRLCNKGISLILGRDHESSNNVYRRLGVLVWDFWRMDFFKMEAPPGTVDIQDGWEYLD